MARKAFLICISQYSNLARRNQLTCATSDQALVASALAANGYAIVNGPASLNPTRSEAWHQLSTFLANAVAAGDDVVVYFSGHGEERNRGFELIFSDFRIDGDEVEAVGTTINWSHLDQIARKSKARFVLFVIDGCRTNFPDGPDVWDLPSVSARGACKRIWLFGCDSGQRAQAPIKGPSHFTKAFCAVAEPAGPARTTHECISYGQQELNLVLGMVQPPPDPQNIVAQGVPATANPYPPYSQWQIFEAPPNILPLPLPAFVVPPPPEPNILKSPDAGGIIPRIGESLVPALLTLRARDGALGAIGLDPAIIGSKQLNKLIWALKIIAVSQEKQNDSDN